MSERAADAVTAPSALLLRRVLGPARLVPCKPEVGRTYYRAETALQVLELLEDPDGGSNSLRQWSAMEADKGDAAKGHDLLQVADTLKRGRTRCAPAAAPHRP